MINIRHKLETNGILATILLIAAPSAVRGQFVENPTVLYTISVPSGGTFGWAVADIRDLNGDGQTDLAVGAVSTNRVHVYSGATGTLIRTLSVSLIEPSAQLGYALADAGDVNADGVTDVVVGAPGANSSRGTVYVFSGTTGNRLLTIPGQVTGDRFGAAVGAAGHVDQDGNADILIGADFNDQMGTNSGRAYVYSGATGTLIRTYEAEGAGHAFGGGIANAGDVNEDGFLDHIVGAYNAGAFNEGRAYVYSGQSGTLLYSLLSVGPGGQFGQFFVARAGDVNGDGTPDLYVGDYAESSGTGRAYVFSGVDGSIMYSLPGPIPGDGQGPGRYAGDVNGDHRADLIVGRYTHSSGASGAGQVAIYSGFDGSVLETFTATTPGGQVGFDAVGLGDVNGDQKLDYLLSAASGDTVYVVSSRLSAAPIPTVSQWGIVVLGLCVMLAGTLLQQKNKVTLLHARTG